MSTARIKSAPQITAQPTLPDANGYSWIYDSTNLDKSFPRDASVPIGKTAAVPAVGPNRGHAINSRINVGVATTGQNVSLVCYTLDGAAAWKLHSTTTITAGNTPQYLEWNVYSADALVGILAGATPPTTVTSTFIMVERA